MDSQQIAGVLTQMGFKPETDQDGDIEFSYRDASFWITLDPEDEEYLKLTSYGLYENSQQLSEDELRLLAYRFTNLYKVNKAEYCGRGPEENVFVMRFCAEAFTNEVALQRLLPRAIGSLIEMGREFSETLEMQTDASQGDSHVG